MNACQATSSWYNYNTIEQYNKKGGKKMLKKEETKFKKGGGGEWRLEEGVWVKLEPATHHGAWPWSVAYQSAHSLHPPAHKPSYKPVRQSSIWQDNHQSDTCNHQSAKPNTVVTHFIQWPRNHQTNLLISHQCDRLNLTDRETQLSNINVMILQVHMSINPITIRLTICIQSFIMAQSHLYAS